MPLIDNRHVDLDAEYERIRGSNFNNDITGPKFAEEAQFIADAKAIGEFMAIDRNNIDGSFNIDDKEKLAGVIHSCVAGKGKYAIRRHMGIFAGDFVHRVQSAMDPADGCFIEDLFGDKLNKRISDTLIKGNDSVNGNLQDVYACAYNLAELEIDCAMEFVTRAVCFLTIRATRVFDDAMYSIVSIYLFNIVDNTVVWLTTIDTWSVYKNAIYRNPRYELDGHPKPQLVLRCDDEYAREHGENYVAYPPKGGSGECCCASYYSKAARHVDFKCRKHRYGETVDMDCQCFDYGDHIHHRYLVPKVVIWGFKKPPSVVRWEDFNWIKG